MIYSRRRLDRLLECMLMTPASGSRGPRDVRGRDWRGWAGGTDLHVEEVELDGVARVDVLVREEELATQQQVLALVDALLAQRLRVIQPVHCKKNTLKMLKLFRKHL